MNPVYEFRIDARDLGKQNLLSVGAFLFLFVVMEAAFVSVWINRHPLSFWLVNIGVAVLTIFFGAVWIRHMRIRGSYHFIITDTLVKADSPHAMMGESFSVSLEKITRLQHLFSTSDEVRDETNNLFAIYHLDGVAYFSEFPGHTGKRVFSEIQKLKPGIPMEERPFTGSESIAFAKRAFSALKT